MASQSRSQHGEDLFIANLLHGDCEKIFVDVGANDGFSWSNSYYFADLGFKLLLIEPLPAYAQFCRIHHASNPKVFVEQCAISDAIGTAKFYVNLDDKNDLLAMASSLYRDAVPSDKVSEIEVVTVPLSYVLSKYSVPDRYAVLSVDAEACDLAVLQTAGLDTKRPRVICVEEGMRSEGIRPYLESKRYKFVEKLGETNAIYIPASD